MKFSSELRNFVPKSFNCCRGCLLYLQFIPKSSQSRSDHIGIIMSPTRLCDKREKMSSVPLTLIQCTILLKCLILVILECILVAHKISSLALVGSHRGISMKWMYFSIISLQTAHNLTVIPFVFFIIWMIYTNTTCFSTYLKATITHWGFFQTKNV